MAQLLGSLFAEAAVKKAAEVPWSAPFVWGEKIRLKQGENWLILVFWKETHGFVFVFGIWKVNSYPEHIVRYHGINSAWQSADPIVNLTEGFTELEKKVVRLDVS